MVSADHPGRIRVTPTVISTKIPITRFCELKAAPNRLDSGWQVADLGIG